MSSKSKIKGSVYEAKIAKLLTNEFKVEFRKVPLSGSIDYLKGDIWTPKDTAWWPYCIECKHYKDIQWNNFLTSKTTDMLMFWRQTVREAEVMEKKPLLIFRWNRSKDFAAFADNLEVDHFVKVKSFGCEFKITLLDEWIKKVKPILCE
jgi:hypothetical protein|tara:strand:+ start:127 stop:573 length:447 start_codon:yes stop_codon:yes gene_type:complete